MKVHSLQFTAHSYKITAKAAVCIIFTVCGLQFTVHAAETVASRDLIENAASFDGREVKYKAEAVTAVLDRGSHSWVNLNDGDNAIGIWCEKERLAGVAFIGNYKNRGDILEVEGVFHRACPEHGGELDIHASSVKVVSPGFPADEAPGERRLKAAAALFLIALFIAILFRRRL